MGEKEAGRSDWFRLELSPSISKGGKLLATATEEWGKVDFFVFPLIRQIFTTALTGRPRPAMNFFWCLFTGPLLIHSFILYTRSVSLQPPVHYRDDITTIAPPT